MDRPMPNELLETFIRDLNEITDVTLPCWLVDGAKYCAATLKRERELIPSTPVLRALLETVVTNNRPDHKGRTAGMEELERFLRALIHSKTLKQPETQEPAIARLIESAAEAVEIFGDDELERFQREQEKEIR